jgi:2,3-bisphosphoglycerate-independent phosphoglycerate mutase
MKFLILLGDGMADYPSPELGGKTPLEAAYTPNMDRIAAQGTLGRIDTIPPGLTPGSDVANLSVLGYDPRRCYSGRGPLEAANMGIKLDQDDVAFRCNLVTLSDDNDPVMMDSTAGHISSAEAAAIIADLDRDIGSEALRFYPGVSYRHLLIWKKGQLGIVATPPHDISGQHTEAHHLQGPGADRLLDLMRRARRLLADHAINRERRARGHKPANAIWLWGQGKAPRIEKLTERFRIRGGVISAVDLLNGIGVYAGLTIIPVPGATGYTDTNYRGKAEYALSALREMDFVFVHVEAPDEMGHEGNLAGKIQAIEDFDAQVVGTVLEGIGKLGDYRVAVLSDHPTPLSLRTHSGEPSPFAVLSSLGVENEAQGYSFSESEAAAAGNLITPGHCFMERFIGEWRPIVQEDTR